MQKLSAQALHGVMLDALKAASQAESYGNSGFSTGYGKTQGKSGGFNSSSTKSATCQRIMDEMNSLNSQVISSSKDHVQLGSADQQAVKDSGQNIETLRKRQNQLMSKAKSMGCL